MGIRKLRIGMLGLLVWAMLAAGPAVCGDVPTSTPTTVPATAPVERSESATTQPGEPDDVAVFDPDAPDNDYGGAGGPAFWLIVLFFCVGFLLILVMIGGFLALIGLALLAALIAAGVVSSSAVAGMAARKPSTFFLWLSVQFGAVLGTLAIAAALVALTHAFDWTLRLRHAAILGGIAGLFGGAALGFLCHKLGTHALTWVGKQFTRQKQP